MALDVSELDERRRQLSERLEQALQRAQTACAFGQQTLKANRALQSELAESSVNVFVKVERGQLTFKIFDHQLQKRLAKAQAKAKAAEQNRRR